MATQFMPQIWRHYDALTPAEKSIADYILQYPSETVQLSASSLAKRAGTAPSAVVRFCKSVGFEGFSAFKVQLAVELSRQAPSSYMASVEPTDSASTVLDKIFTANVKALQDTLSRIDRKAFTEVAALLSNANTIHIYGVGTSAPMVYELHHRLMLLGFQVHNYTDLVSVRLSTMNLKPGDVAFGISHTGRTETTVDALTLSKEAGAATVCLTSYAGSPITQISDHVLTVFCDETRYPVEASSARIAQTCVIDALVAVLSTMCYEKATQRSRQMHDLLEAVRYQKRR